jgi:hypothetical protein
MVRLFYSFSNMAELVEFALLTLRDLSPVGSTGDEHPGLYRESWFTLVTRSPHATCGRRSRGTVRWRGSYSAGAPTATI